MSVRFDAKEITKFLFEYLDLQELKDGWNGLKEFDWNPFNEDDDEYETPWEEMQHNWDILWNTVLAFAHTVDRIRIGGNELTYRERHAVVKEALDRAINLPWFLEPFDGLALDMLIKGAVEAMHAIDFGDDDEAGDIELTEWKEIG